MKEHAHAVELKEDIRLKEKGGRASITICVCKWHRRKEIGGTIPHRIWFQ